MAKLLLNNGKIFEGTSIGAKGTFYGELSFNTSMYGYQEILTNPAYAEQIIVMTYPEIGNCGIHKNKSDNNKIFAKGLVIKNYCQNENHYLSEQTLSDFLTENNIIAISDIDTRELTKIINNFDCTSCLITTEEISDEMRENLKNWKPDKDITKKISKNLKYEIKGTGLNVAIIDLGLRNDILEKLSGLNCNISVFPYNSSSDEILKTKPDVLIVSNGVGNPNDIPETVKTIKDLIGQLPIFGICLGSQAVALATGAIVNYQSYRHNSDNMPVMDTLMQKVFLAEQHHSYFIDETTLPKNTIITYKNLNDNTMEGYLNNDLKITGIQFYPSEDNCILDDWIKQKEGNKLCLKDYI